MAQQWIATPWKRLKLAGLNMFARGTRPFLRGGASLQVARAAVERVLVVELWNIGDVVLTIPFLAQVRALFPNATTTLLARSHAKIILTGMNLVDEFIEADLSPVESWLTHNTKSHNWTELRRFRRRLKSHDFDIAFQCRMHVREHVLLAMSNARRRVGYGLGFGDHMLTDAIAVDDQGRHKADDWLRLLAPFGGPVDAIIPLLHVTEGEQRWAKQYLMDRGITMSHTVVGVHPGASTAAKRWPLERFCAVATALSAGPGIRVLTFVDPAGYGDDLRDVPASVSAKVDLRQMIALLQCCTVLVCNDSGPMHLAGGLNIPTVAVFGKGIAQWFAPLGSGHEVVSASGTANPGVATDPATTDSLGDVAVASVLEAAQRVLSRSRVARTLTSDGSRSHR